MDDKPRMFRRRTDKIYATLQQVQRRITQGTEPGQPPPNETVYTTGSSRPATAAPHHGIQRSISQSQPSGSGYMVTPDGRRVVDEPDRASHPTAGEGHASQTPVAEGDAPSHPMEQALQGWDRPGMEPPPPAPVPLLPGGGWGRSASQPPRPPQPEAPREAAPGAEGMAPNPALKLAAKEGRPRRLEIGIELATVLAIAWLGTLAVAFFIGRGEFTGSGFDDLPGREVGSQVTASGTEAATGEGTTAPVSRPAPPPVTVEGNGSEILLLQSISAGYSREAEARFQDLAEKLNTAAREGNFDPLFGVRRHSSGGLQLVYGKVRGGFGIRRDDQRGKDITDALQSRFSGMKWIDLN